MVSAMVQFRIAVFGFQSKARYFFVPLSSSSAFGLMALELLKSCLRLKGTREDSGLMG